MGKWISPNLSLPQVFQCLGHSNWTILEPYLFLSRMRNEMSMAPSLCLQCQAKSAIDAQWEVGCASAHDSRTDGGEFSIGDRRSVI